MNEEHVRALLRVIAQNEPVKFGGDYHDDLALECVHRGWATKENGWYWSTLKGRTVSQEAQR